MKSFALASLTLLLSTAAFSETTAPRAAWTAPPGWTVTQGGEGGRTIEVTTLKPSGPGSITEAIATKGPRTIVFRVGGTIDLAGHSLKISEPSLTIAGESAPSPGITFIRGGIGVSTHDVVIRHLRIRVGEAGRAKNSGWETDGISTAGKACDVIIDHCSVAWATDENISASGPRFEGETPEEWRENTSHRITISHCIIGEGLMHSTHAKTHGHSMGSLIHDNTSQILIYGNLYISNNARNPLFKGGARGAVINNLIQNPGAYALHFGLVPDEWKGHDWQTARISCAGNVLHEGRSTKIGRGFSAFRGPCEVWFSDNSHFDAKGQQLPFRVEYFDQSGKRSETPTQNQKITDQPPVWPEGLVALPASETKRWVLKNVGARPWERDSVDLRLIDEAEKGTGKIINAESEVGSYEGIIVP